MGTRAKKRITITVDPEEYAQWEKFRLATGFSKAQFCRTAINTFIQDVQMQATLLQDANAMAHIGKAIGRPEVFAAIARAQGVEGDVSIRDGADMLDAIDEFGERQRAKKKAAKKAAKKASKKRKR